DSKREAHMVTISDAISVALRHHRSGDLIQAEPIYREILAIDPSHVQAWFLLGVLCQASGRIEETLDCYRHALRLQPNLAEAHNNLGVALEHQGKRHEGLACYRRAVQVKP